MEYDLQKRLAVLENKAANNMHDYGRTVRVPYVNNRFLTGAGALVSNCDDLQKWYECLKERKLLSEKAYQRYFAENRNHYCYGLERHDRNGVTMCAHGGDANGIAAYTQYFFEDDLCIIILSNNESLNQYRLGECIVSILYGKEPEHAVKPEEVPVPEEELRKFTGTYFPGKIHMEMKNGKLYLVRVNQGIHIELYCIGPNTFIRRNEEQSYTHNLLPDGTEKPTVWGYELISKAFEQQPERRCCGCFVFACGTACGMLYSDHRNTDGGKDHEAYKMGDLVSRRCFCSAQGLIKDETCTEQPDPFRPIRLCATWNQHM